MTDVKAESKGNVVLRDQIPTLVSGLTYWRDDGKPVDANPLWNCGFNYLAFKLQVLGRLRLYAQVELATDNRMNLLYVCSGSDEFCRVVESLGLKVTTLDMNSNEYSRRHITKFLQNDRESVALMSELVRANDVILWDTSLGHLDKAFVSEAFRLLSGKTYLLGLYDVPKLSQFGPRIKSDPMMANIISNSPTVNPGLYEQVLKGCSLRCSVDQGAFTLHLYDNVIEFPINDKTIALLLAAANAF
jgi:hypothetical protein